MHGIGKCEHKGCVSTKVAFSESCWEHTREKTDYINSIVDKNAQGVSFEGMNFSKVCFRDIDLQRADFSKANLTKTDFSGANLFDSNFQNAEILGGNFSGADLTECSFDSADLTKASLLGARLWHCDLKNANLVEANLSNTDLWKAELYNIRLWRTNFKDVSGLERKSFQGRKGRYFREYRINEKGISSAENAYRTLKRHFLASGRYTDASWASFREKSMEKVRFFRKRDLAFIPSFIMDILCGFGEKPYRVILSSSVFVMFYAFISYVTDSVVYSGMTKAILSKADYIYFSIITFTTVGYGDFIPKACPLSRMLAACEAFTGIFMTGLFIFTLARKYSAR